MSDVIMDEKFHVSSLQLMELAGFHAASYIRHVLQHDTEKSIVFCCGTGHNGGDGLVAARYLIGWGFDVSVYIPEETLSPISQTHLTALEDLDCDPELFEQLDDFVLIQADLLVDAVFGIGLNRSPSGLYGSVIDEMNRSGTPIIALDIPSGMDANTGQTYSPCISAQSTLTFGFPKVGFKAPSSTTGKIVVADLGFHTPLLKKLGILK